MKNKLLEQYMRLLEGKIEELTNKYKPMIKRDYELKMLEELAQNSSVNYEWLLKRFVEEKDNYQDNGSGYSQLIEVLENFFGKFLKLKKSNKIEQNDIQQIKSLAELKQIVNSYYSYDDIQTDTDVELIIYNDRWLVFQPENFKGSQKWGWSKWCTTYDDDQWDMHNIGEGTLLYLINKFEPELNVAIEQVAQNRYTMWDWTDDPYECFNEREVKNYLNSYINDGYLDVQKVLDNLPTVRNSTFTDYYADMIWDMYQKDQIPIDGINHNIYDEHGNNPDFDEDTFTRDDLNDLDPRDLRLIIQDYQ